MTIELEHRVERLEADMSELKELVRQNTQQISSLSFEVQRVLAGLGEATARNTSAVDSLVSAVRSTNERIDTAFQVIQVMQSEVREIQTDVRGLQTENRRILDRLEGHLSDGHSA
jgi:chromosome segregation ATPase